MTWAFVIALILLVLVALSNFALQKRVRQLEQEVTKQFTDMGLPEEAAREDAQNLSMVSDANAFAQAVRSLAANMH